MTYAITVEGSAAVPEIMPVMQAAFDPAYGEAWTEAQCTGALGLPGTALYVARCESKAVGFAIVRTVVDECELMLIAVSPHIQRSGVGQALLANVTRICRDNNVNYIYIEMRNDNPARHFYMNAGFTVIGERRNYYRRTDGKSADALTFRLSLG